MATAKAAHAKELAKLREQLLADIDKVIKQTDDMGGGIDYMIRERRGFAEVGVTPILPKLKPLSDKYLDAKETADTALAEAYAKAIESSAAAGKVADVTVLKAELKAMQAAKDTPATPPAKVAVGPAGEADRAREAVSRARRIYEAEVTAFKKAVADSFDKREEAIRKSGDKKALDDLKAQRKAFEESDEAPAALPTALKSQLATARAAMEKAYQAAVREFIRLKMDAEAEATEKGKDQAVLLSAFLTGKRTYLSKLKPIKIDNLLEPFEANTAKAKATPDDKVVANSLFIHPRDSAAASVSYVLPGKSVAFRAVVGIPGHSVGMQNPHSPITFELLLDGKSVWKSEPVTELNKVQTCSITVEKGKVMTLRMTAKASANYAHGVWFAPVVVE